MSSINIIGDHDTQTIDQLKNCVTAEEGSKGVLCADGHLGYSMPIGGVVAYRDHISPSGVGYDIACGNMAVRTNIKASDLNIEGLGKVADEIAKQISFGMGRNNPQKVEDSVFDIINKSGVKQQREMLQMAQNQLGTVGSGNHYVDVLEELGVEDPYLWVAVHFGSRGFGHKTAKGFLNLHNGKEWDEHGSEGEMMSPPVLFPVFAPIGQDYLEAMNVAGEYAYAGRRQVVKKVLEILGAKATFTVHNHHNFAWREIHDSDIYWVVRKGATPAQAGQKGFVGGSMGDNCVVLEGVEGDAAKSTLYSTVHGAGRVMSRNQAIKGRHVWECPFTLNTSAAPYRCKVTFTPPREKPPKDMKCPVHHVQLVKEQLEAPINFRDVQDRLKKQGVVLRGAGPDESPQVYRPLSSVLKAHSDSIRVLHTLKPRIVVMAGRDVRDPYKD